MTAFYVGQMVRVNCPSSVEHGAETRITALDVLSYDGDGVFYMGHEVDIPIEDYSEMEGDSTVFSPDELEPITRLDNTATTWDAMPCGRNGKFNGVPA